MVTLGDVRPLFHGARIFGCGPHVVTESDVLLTSAGLAYSGLWGLGFLMSCCWGLYLIERERDSQERNVKILTSVRTLLLYGCFFADGILTIVWNERLRSALTQLRNFDVTVNYPM